MKKLILILLALLIPSSVVVAQDITAETPPAKPVAGYNGGFFVQNPDGEFQLKIRGRIQPQYYFENGKLGSEAVNTFRMRRAAMSISGTFAKNWGFFSLIQNNSGPGQAASALYWEANVSYKPSPYFNLTMGTITVPMDRIGQTSSATLMMVNAPLVTIQSDGIQDLSISRPSFGFSNTPGLYISGTAFENKLNYAIGAGNGPNPTGTANSQYTSNFNKRMSGAARLQYNILKDPGFGQDDVGWSESPALAFAIGGGYLDQGAADSYTATSANPIFFRYNLQGTADLAFKYKGFSLLGAWYGRVQYCSAIATGNLFTLQDAGYYAMAGYFVIPKRLELAAEVSQLFREGPHNDSSEYYGGVNFYIFGNDLKWQTNVGRTDNFDQIDGTNGQTLWRVWSMITMNI